MCQANSSSHGRGDHKHSKVNPTMSQMVKNCSGDGVEVLSTLGISAVLYGAQGTAH